MNTLQLLALGLSVVGVGFSLYALILARRVRRKVDQILDELNGPML